MKKTNKFIKGEFCNREYSWLQFDRRVLDQATDETNPLLERCKFLSITTSNLDEFFMVRVGSLYNEMLVSPSERENKTDLTPEEQIDGILSEAKGIYKDVANVYKKLCKELSAQGISFVKAKNLSQTQEKKCREYFRAEILPLLSPMVLDAKHPMMQFENNRMYAVCRLEKGGRNMVGVIGVSPKLPRVFNILPGKKVKLITAEELMSKFAAEAFEGYNFKSGGLVRVTRNADFDASVDDNDVERDFDFSEFLKRKVELRALSSPVRLELYGDCDDIKQFVLKAIGLKNKYCFTVRGCFDYKFMFSLKKYLSQESAAALLYPPFKGKFPSALENVPLIDAVKNKDIFLSYPFQTMDVLVKLLEECAEDKRVVSIKITIYRLDERSRIVEALKKASENGKDVTVVIELCARFDEENNLHYASVLQDAGCTIIYGMENYKVHSKIISVVLSENGKLGYITHLGTGNYNEGTAKQYTDLNVITANKQIGEDAVAFFRNVSICNTDYDYKRLLIAPENLKKGIIKLIERETEKAKRGESAQILAKMNSLTDKQIMNSLIEASQAGVKIKLVVRGICCLLPGIPGKTENISVVSIVGRFLEHSRIYCFGEGKDRVIYISSADLMTRNTDKRVEIATPVLDKSIADKIYSMLHVMLSDNVKGRILASDGTYSAPVSDAPVNSQETFLAEARN